MRVLSYFLISLSVLLLSLNAIGIFVDLRPDRFYENDLRFENDIVLTFEEAIEQIARIPEENNDDYLPRLADVLQKSVAHIEWNAVEDTRKYNQLIPPEENYFLTLMGIFSGIPEFERYHFASYKKAIERGIGLCGDMSMISVQVLQENGLDGDIITFPGHVIAEVKDFQRNRLGVLDADFGVYVPYSFFDILKNPRLIYDYYIDAGHSVEDVEYLITRFEIGTYKYFDDEKHFITKKYYFEYISYVMKWAFPVAILFLSVFLLYRKRES